MRIWSLHPKYLDSKGLVALWREALLAKHVLEGKTKGYKKHTQLIRFQATKHPVNAIHQYLKDVFKEAEKRNYKFDRRKINWRLTSVKIKVNRDQIKFEAQHLLNKLSVRDRVRYNELKTNDNFECHPLFKITKGEIEQWEIQPDKKKKATVKV